MKPHPRLRKTIKWRGTAMAVLLVGAGVSVGLWIGFWPFVMLMPLVMLVAWRRDIAARRQVRLNLCPACNYDRTGLPTGGPCPECGMVPEGESGV